MVVEELIEKLAQESAITHQESSDFIKTFADIVRETIAKGDCVKIVKFGTFRPKYYRQLGPQKEGLVAPHFKVGEYLKSQIQV